MMTNLNNRNQLPEDKGNISESLFGSLGILSLSCLLISTAIALMSVISSSCSGGEFGLSGPLLYTQGIWLLGSLLAILTLISFLFFVRAGRTKNKHIALFLMVILVPTGFQGLWWVGALLAILTLIFFSVFHLYQERTTNKHIALILGVIFVPIGSCVINFSTFISC